jgi:hypothetical protein
MTKQKSFKRRVRARMEKTSESYSAARLQLLAKATPAEELEPPAPADSNPPQPVDTGVEAAKTSDDAVALRTGREYGEWFALLDAWGAVERRHPEIARWLTEEHGINGWWAQSVTVAYEQARGLRVPGEHVDGFTVTASKTIDVPVERLFEAFSDDAFRATWLPADGLQVTTVNSPKSFRGKWGDDGSRIAAGFVAKSESKSMVAVAHEKLSSAEGAKQMKDFWGDRLKELKKLLED